MIRKLRVTVAGQAYDVEVELLDEDGVAPAKSPRATTAPVAAAAPPTTPAPASARSAPPAGDGAVVSPLAGKVVSIDCAVGQAVKAGSNIITLEAMKMNTFVPAPSDGTVSAIHTSEGDGVEEGQPLVTIG